MTATRSIYWLAFALAYMFIAVVAVRAEGTGGALVAVAHHAVAVAR